MDSAAYVLPLAAISGLLVAASALLLYLRRRQSNLDNVAQPADEVTDPREVVHVLFGTQTGTAERFAKQLAGKLNDRYGIDLRFDIQDMEHFDHAGALPGAKMLFFLMATYGDGEPTDNAMRFHEWLCAKADAVMDGDAEEPIKGVPFAVFGLGNRQYEHFNAVGKSVHKQLRILGGRPVVDVGLGDDDDDIADDFETWLEQLISGLDAEPLLAQQRVAPRDAQPTCGKVKGYEVVRAGAGAVNGGAALPWAGIREEGVHAARLASVRAVRELHSHASERSCVHVELDLQGTGVSYEHGDHVAVHARNSPSTVDLACSVLGEDGATYVTLRLPDGNPEMLLAPPPGPLLLRDLLAHHYELLQHPSKDALAVLAAYATDADEAAWLSRLARHDGKAEFAEYVVKSKRSLLEVLQAAPSARPPLGVFFAAVATRLSPRYYSISSSPLVHPTTVHITAAVVDEATPTGRQHEGVASKDLAQAKPAQTFPIFVRSAARFKLPASAAVPIVMVGPGTGIAPFRAFLQHRAALKRCGEQLGPALLYFGCRHPDHDYIYRDELEGYLADGTLTHLSTAFSRARAEKDYVQHHMLRDARMVYDALQQGGRVYVCGDAKFMAKDVHRCLHDVVRRCTGCAGTQAEAYVHELQTSGRYMQDVW